MLSRFLDPITNQRFRFFSLVLMLGMGLQAELFLVLQHLGALVLQDVGGVPVGRVHGVLGLTSSIIELLADPSRDFQLFFPLIFSFLSFLSGRVGGGVSALHPSGKRGVPFDAHVLVAHELFCFLPEPGICPKDFIHKVCEEKQFVFRVCELNLTKVVRD